MCDFNFYNAENKNRINEIRKKEREVAWKYIKYAFQELTRGDTTS